MARSGKPSSKDSTDPGISRPPSAPEVVEHNPDTGWELWMRIEEAQDKPFPPTAPASLAGPLRAADSVYGETAPGHMAGGDLSRRTDGRDMLDDALEEARWRNRVCLKPELWKRMFDLLTARAGETGGEKPPLPPLGPQWATTSAIPKRLRFQEHLMWADKHGALVPVLAFMRSLKEEDWVHMGE